jgi:hypothetical protein
LYYDLKSIKYPPACVIYLHRPPLFLELSKFKPEFQIRFTPNPKSDQLLKAIFEGKEATSRFNFNNRTIID